MNQGKKIEDHKKEAVSSLLGPDDPAACVIKKGSSPLIIAGPHNGYHVPESLYRDNQPLGLHESCFDPKSPFKRHEACDWGVEDLFKELQEIDTLNDKSHSYISGQYSRLICDLNRTTELSITQKSSETHTPIPGNLDIDAAEEMQRLSDIYTPYHQNLRNMLIETRERYGYAIFLDLHSYTPVWDGAERPVHVSTTACSDHPVERLVANHMNKSCTTQDLNFMPHEPYNLKAMPALAATAHKIEEIGVWYTGLEVRSDLLEEAEYAKSMAQSIHDMCAELLEHHDTEIFVKEKQPEKA